MNDREPRFWGGVVRRLGAELPAFALEAWILPLAPRREEDGGLRLACPSALHLERVRARYLAKIARGVAAELGEEVPISLAVALDPAQRQTRAPLRLPAGEPARPAAGTRAPKAAPAQRSLPFTFETFVVGSCNALAREAAFALAEGRQRTANPLFLASAPGLGKTHLSRAIALRAARADGAASRVLCGSAESFTNEFMAAIRSREMDRFKQRFRRGCDLLVVEDVEFLDSKKATQLELFHTLAHLLDTGARVVLTGSRLPREIAGLDPRLRSQMAAGLVAEIEPPDATVRREILRRKAAAGGVRVPGECLELLVERARGSVRDLEGVLIQLVASASLLKRRIDRPLTEAALAKLAPPPPRRLELAQVVEVVAAFFRTRPEVLASRSRRRDVLAPRQLAMYLCRRYTDEPASAIGRALGRRHTAVENAVAKVERLLLERAPLRYQVEALTQRLDDLQRRRD